MHDEDHTLVYLVHGTFAPDASWIQEDSPFSGRLKQQLLGPVKIVPFRWSGQNSFAERLCAADALSEQLISSPQPCFVCAHSHGGNIVSYLLRDRPALMSKIQGVAFLATPFLTYRLAPSWRFLINGLLSPLFVFVAFVSFVLTSMIVVYLIGPKPFGAFSPYARIFLDVIAGTLLNFLSIVAALAGILALNRYKRFLVRKNLHSALRLSRLYSSPLPSGLNAIFIRTTGDEASAFLGFWQSITWVATSLNAKLGKMYYFFTRGWSVTRIKHPLRALAYILAFCIVHTAANAIVSYDTSFRAPSEYTDAADFVMRSNARVEELLGFWRTSLGDLSNQWRLFIALCYYFGLAFAELAIIVITPILFALSFVVFCLNAALSLWFGRLPFLVSGLLQVAVETTPPGNWSVMHVAWNNPNAVGLRHSNPYNETQVIDYVAKWIGMSRDGRTN